MKSSYGDRETIGSQYVEAQKQGLKGITLGDVNAELCNSLIDDLNESIKSDPFQGRPFYINVVEERDLLMKNAIKRRMFVSLYRPYPEDNTLVFKVDPKDNEVFYCWDLPHHSENVNILINAHLHDQEYIQNIKNFYKNDLLNFGFIKVSMNNSQVEGYDEKTINAYRQAYENYCNSIDMDAKAVETEKRLGYFWIPNKYFKDKCITNKKKAFHLITV